MVMTTTVGLRELRQHASEVIRRVERGERVIVTVSGRDVAEIAATGPRPWRTYDEVADVWAGGPYGMLERDLFDDELRDPFDRPSA